MNGGLILPQLSPKAALNASGFPVSDEQAHSSKLIIKSFKDNVSKSQVGRLESGHNRLLVGMFIAENRKLISLSKKQHKMRALSQVEGSSDPLSAFSTLSQSGASRYPVKKNTGGPSVLGNGALK
jgi:hypothetical protein